MSKRSADEAEIASNGLAKRVKRKEEKLKKARDQTQKDKPSVDEPTPQAQNGGKEAEDDTEDLRKQRKKERKLAKKLAREGDTAVASQVEDVKRDAEEDRRQKKAAKAAKKAAKNENNTTTADVVASSNSEKTKAASKDSLHSIGASDQGSSPNSKYNTHPDLRALDQTSIDSFLTEKSIVVTQADRSNSSLRPIIDFKHLPTGDKYTSFFAGFSAPTPIQATAWPYLFAGRDVIGVAETGSGKTLAFGLPCVQHIAGIMNSKKNTVHAVIVSPTRELATQIYDQLKKLVETTPIKAVCVYGGVPKDEQRKLLKGASIVVATPGRLNDYIGDGSLDLSSTSYLVLDEADRMLDKGFEDDVRKIISATLPTEQRQTLMFTATWPESVRQLAATFMKHPVRINVGHATGELRANTRIAQIVEVIKPLDKQYRLVELLRKHWNDRNNDKNDRILVFCLYKKEADRTLYYLQSKGVKCAAIHGDMTQQQRFRSLEQFKTGEVPCLIATDVAARGLDIPEVKLVINATFPLTAEDYVHRIGRTGRAGADGKAITLFTEHDKPLAGALINVLKAANQPVPKDLLAFGSTVKKKGHEHYGAFYKDAGPMKAATKVKFDD